MVKGLTLFKKISAAVCLFFVFLVLTSSAAHARLYQNIVAFGDSLSDHYGLQGYLGPYDPVTNPTGVLEVWSNGDVWVEYLSGNWGAVLDNNAIAGAMTQGHENDSIQFLTDSGILPNLGLVGQVDLYVASSPVIDALNTLFTIWIGGNDLLEFGRGEYPTADPAVMVADAMTRISNSVLSLYAQGARHFLILNLPDIGKSPGYCNQPPAEIAAVTQIVQAYNTALATVVQTFETDLTDIIIYSFDIFSYMNKMINSGAFVNTTGTYMELDSEGNQTGNVNGNAEDYLFWDNIHPMTQAHKMIADEMDQTLFSLVGGSGSLCFIDSVVNGQAGAGAYRLLLMIAALFSLGLATAVVQKKP